MIPLANAVAVGNAVASAVGERVAALEYMQVIGVFSGFVALYCHCNYQYTTTPYHTKTQRPSRKN